MNKTRFVAGSLATAATSACDSFTCARVAQLHTPCTPCTNYIPPCTRYKWRMWPFNSSFYTLTAVGRLVAISWRSVPFKAAGVNAVMLPAAGTSRKVDVGGHLESVRVCDLLETLSATSSQRR
ncbi:hypothetical protein MRX96_039945 [Rhipicephalus microplus]